MLYSNNRYNLLRDQNIITTAAFPTSSWKLEKVWLKNQIFVFDMSVFKRWENYSNGHSLHMVTLVIYYLLHTWGVRKSPINNRPLCVFWGRIYWAKIAIFLEVAFVWRKRTLNMISSLKKWWNYKNICTQKLSYFFK